jgi:hypothetical protein
MPTRVGPKLMSLQRFRVEEGTCPGEGVSGTMDERPEVDSGRPAPTEICPNQRCRRVSSSAAIGLMPNHASIYVRNSKVLKP